MRQPTFRRGPTRQQRLIRTGIGVVIVIGIAAIIASLLGGGDEPTDQAFSVSFKTRSKAHADTGNLERADTVKKGTVRAAADEIEGLLTTLYQQAFVDPAVFEAGAENFPPDAVLGLFTEDARDDAEADVEALTLGTERLDYARVEPGKARAAITVLFEKARKPVLAVAEVHFEATAIPRDGSGLPLAIVQDASFHLERTGDGWRISYYDAKQDQDSIVASPSPTEDA